MAQIGREIGPPFQEPMDLPQHEQLPVVPDYPPVEQPEKVPA